MSGVPAARSLLQLVCIYSSEGISMKWQHNAAVKQLQLLIKKRFAETDTETGKNNSNHNKTTTTTTTPVPIVPICVRLFALPTDDSLYAAESAACDV